MHGGPAVNADLHALGLPPVATDIPASPFVRVVWNPQGFGAPICRATPDGVLPRRPVRRRRRRRPLRHRRQGGVERRRRLYAAHPGKPFAFPEWGLWGIDDPLFVRRMAQFVRLPRAHEADRVLQGEGRLDLRPRVEATLARRLQALHRAARGLSESAAGGDVRASSPAPRAPPAPRRAARAARGRASTRSRARAVAERDRARLAAVLAADADLDVAA